MMLKQLLDPGILMVTWPVFLFSLSMHEFFHAWSSDRLGDPTARLSGRLTLNPLSHYDPIGTTLGMVFRTFGWAKPVPVSPIFFRRPRRDMMLTALAGPASNVALALVFGAAFKLLQRVDPADLAASRTLDLFLKMAGYGIVLNLTLAVFNLIPVFPLDGHHVLRGLLRPNVAATFDRTRQAGPLLLVMVVLWGGWLLFAVRDFFLRYAMSETELAGLARILSQLFPR